MCASKWFNCFRTPENANQLTQTPQKTPKTKPVITKAVARIKAFPIRLERRNAIPNRDGAAIWATGDACTCKTKSSSRVFSRPRYASWQSGSPLRDHIASWRGTGKAWVPNEISAGLSSETAEENICRRKWAIEAARAYVASMQAGFLACFFPLNFVAYLNADSTETRWFRRAAFKTRTVCAYDQKRHRRLCLEPMFCAGYR